MTLAADVAIGLGTDVEIGRHPLIHPGRQDQHRHGQHHPQRQAGKLKYVPSVLNVMLSWSTTVIIFL